MKRTGISVSAAMTLALGIVLAFASVAGKAQTIGGTGLPDIQKDWSIRLGLFIFNSSTARAQAGEAGISGIVERTIYRNDTAEVNVGIGYNGGTSDVYSIPLTISGIASKNNIRYGATTGYAFGKRIDGRGTSGPLLGFILGYRLTEGRTPLSLDLRYNFISGSDSELDGYSITLGARF